MFKKKQLNKIKEYPKVRINFYPRIPNLKKNPDKTKINVRYPLIEPFAFAHIYWNPKIYELVYEIEEPELSVMEFEIKDKLVRVMREIIDFEEIVEKKEEKLMDYIDERFKFLATELGMDIPYESYRKIYYYLCRDFIGFNELDPLLRDFFVEDIECNGINTPTYLVHRQYRNLKTNLVYKSNDILESFVEKLAQKCGKYISYSKPILDGTLSDGSRVNATYTKDVTSRGPTFTIRKFTKTPWTPSHLISFGTLSPEMLAYLWLLIQYKMNILIVGGTSSGKTTFLNALAFFIPPEMRVVSIEDTREINLPRENWLPSVTRSATGLEESGEIDLFALLKSSFRQNPEYVIVGEVRGKEASVLFQGMASGHASISTMHADSVDTVIKRLQTPPIELSPTLLDVLDCVCVMTHAMVEKQETRKLREIVEIINVDDEGVANTNTPFIWNPAENQFYFKTNSRILNKISTRYGISQEKLKEELQRRVKILYKLYEKRVYGFREFQNIINEYYKKPLDVLRNLGLQ
jgi:archaeal flagellar protein FlaI